MNRKKTASTKATKETKGTVRGPRLLRGTEVVRTGDFVEGKDGEGSYVPWEGPSGFQANAFIKPIYRGRLRASPPRQPTAAKRPVSAPPA